MGLVGRLRYTYAEGDPVDFVDPLGTIAAPSPSDPSIGSVREYCEREVASMPMIGGMGISPYCMLVLSPPSSGRKTLPKAGIPTYLRVVSDCYEDVIGYGLVRCREYQLLDGEFEPMIDSAAHVDESITDITPGGNTINAGRGWDLMNDPTLGLGAVFFDFYGNGGNGSPTNAFQRFTATLDGSSHGLVVLEPNGSNVPQGYTKYGVQGVWYSQGYVRIDNFKRNPFVPGKQGCDWGQHLFDNGVSPRRWPG